MMKQDERKMENVYRVDHVPVLAKTFVTDALTRDQFAVANLLVRGFVFAVDSSGCRSALLSLRRAVFS